MITEEVKKYIKEQINITFEHIYSKITSLEEQIGKILSDDQNVKQKIEQFEEIIRLTFLQSQKIVQNQECHIRNGTQRKVTEYLNNLQQSIKKFNPQNIPDFSYNMKQNDNITPTNYPNDISIDQNQKQQFQEYQTFVFYTNTGLRYHKEFCNNLSNSKIKSTLEEAIKLNKTPCKSCHRQDQIVQQY